MKTKTQGGQSMYYVSRAVYERLYLAVPGESPEDAAAYVEGLYPLSTTQTLIELRTRGLNASWDELMYAIESGKVSPAPKEPRGYNWSKGDVEAAAAELDRLDKRTPWGFFVELFDLDADQDVEARDEAIRAGKGTCLSDLGAIIQPGLPGRGIPATIRYLSRARAMGIWKVGG